MPNEQFIYYGDTAHLPYGDKSEDALISYVESIAQFLKDKSCKMIVVACNSATTVISKATLPFQRSAVVEVISPIIDLISTQSKFHNIGIIGTRKTIGSGMFNKTLAERNPNLKITAKATPLLVPVIEEGFIGEEVLFPVFDKYFKDFHECDLMIPACTHYPIIYKEIEKYFNNSLKVLHTPKIVAETVQKRLEEFQLLNKDETKKKDEFHLSDITDEFIQEAALFLGESVNFEKTLLNL